MNKLPAGIVWISSQVSTEHCADQSEGEDDEDADAGDRYHSAEGDGAGGVVVDCDEVDEEGGAAHNQRQQEGGAEHLANPAATTHPENKEK